MLHNEAASLWAFFILRVIIQVILTYFTWKRKRRLEFIYSGRLLAFQGVFGNWASARLHRKGGWCGKQQFSKEEGDLMAAVISGNWWRLNSATSNRRCNSHQGACCKPCLRSFEKRLIKSFLQAAIKKEEQHYERNAASAVAWQGLVRETKITPSVIFALPGRAGCVAGISWVKAGNEGYFCHFGRSDFANLPNC